MSSLHATICITLTGVVVLACALRPAAAADPLPLRFTFDAVPETIEFSREQPLFEIDTRVEGTWRRDEPVTTSADFQSVERHDDGDVTTLVFTGPPEPWADVRVTVAFTRREKEVEATIEVENHGPTPVNCVRFPYLHARPTHPFDRLLLSHNAGENIRYPNRHLGGRLGGQICIWYPAQLAMQYGVLYNAARSVYLSAYSTRDETFSLSAQNISGGLLLCCSWYPFLADGTWKSPPCGFAVFRGGWHSSADLYRSRMAAIFKPPTLPQWMQDEFHGWVQLGLKGGSPTPKYRFSELPDVYRRIAEIGMNTLHIYSWCPKGLDHLYPEYWPSPNLGTEEELRAAMDEIKAMGGHVDFYTNGRLLDPDTDWFRQHGVASFAVSSEGEPYIERYAGVQFRVACPMAKAYQDTMVETFERMIGRYHIGGAQIDQIACTPGNFCYSRDHGHAKPNTNWFPGLETMLSRIRGVYTRMDSDFFTWEEGVNERLGQYVEVSQSHGEDYSWTGDDSLPEQFRYTYPDYVVTGLCDSIETLCYTFGQGKPFDFQLRRLDRPDFARLVKDLIAVRKAERAYFLRGRFTDTMGLEWTGGDVRCWGLRRADNRGILVNFWARGTQPGQSAEAHIRSPREGCEARAVYPDDLKITSDGRWLSLRWTGPVATLVWED